MRGEQHLGLPKTPDTNAQLLPIPANAVFSGWDNSVHELWQFFVLLFVFVVVIGLLLQCVWLIDAQQQSTARVKDDSIRWEHFARTFRWNCSTAPDHHLDAHHHSSSAHDHRRHIVKIGFACHDLDVCELGSFCDNDGVCRAEPNFGTACQYDAQCRRGYLSMPLSCVSSQCDLQRASNEHCRESAQCLSGRCEHSRCVASVRVGQPCSPIEENACEAGHFCSAESGTCEPSIARGDTCAHQMFSLLSSSNHYSVCQPGTLCDGDVCRTMFSREVSELCQSHLDCRFICEWGLSFDGNYCRRECADGVPCLTFCQCESSHFGHCYSGSTHCQRVVDALIGCVQKNKCYFNPRHLPTAIHQENTCLSRCYQQIQEQTKGEHFRSCLEHFSPFYHHDRFYG